MQCKKCKSKLKAGAKFCGVCGKKIAGQPLSKVHSLSTETNTFNEDENIELSKLRIEQEKLKLMQQEAEGKTKCPICQSTSVQSKDKGFGYGTATVGALLFGPIGMLAGGIGSKDHIRRCTKCGFEY